MDWKTFVKRVFFPHPAVVWVLWPAALCLLICSAVRYSPTDMISIAAYAFSFYALVLVSLRVPALIRFGQRFRRENRYAVRYASDLQMRINLSLFLSFAFNAIYAVFQLCLGLWHQSVWFYSMAGYHLLLALMRLLLVRYTRRHMPGEQQELEWRKYRLCGVLLLLTTLALAIFIIYFVWRIRVFRHHEITTIAMAAYTFASLALAIVNIIRTRKSGSPALSAARLISLASAAVSVLTLENALLTAFGQESDELFRRIILGATGVCVVCAVQGIAIWMLINAAGNIGKKAGSA